MLGVIAGYDPNDSTTIREAVPDYRQSLDRDIKGIRVGVIRELQGRLAPEVADSFGAAMKQLAALGATVDEVSIPSIDGAVTVALNIIWSEALEYHESMLKMHADDYGRGVRRTLEMGMTMPVTSYIRAQRARPRILGETMRAPAKFDVLAKPSSATPPPKLRETPGSSCTSTLAA